MKFWGKGLRPSPENGVKNPGSLGQNCLKRATITGITCCGINWSVSVACMACHGSDKGSNFKK